MPLLTKGTVHTVLCKTMYFNCAIVVIYNFRLLGILASTTKCVHGKVKASWKASGNVETKIGKVKTRGIESHYNLKIKLPRLVFKN